MGKYDDRDYSVGKGKPPAEHRWSKGQSGNPRGPRKRADRDEATADELLAEIINEKAKVMLNGKEVWIPKKELILIGLVHDAVNGTPAVRLRAYKALREEGALNLLPRGKQLSPEQEQTNINEIVMRLAEQAAANDPKYTAQLRAWRAPEVGSPPINLDDQ